jgi:hypothetical protein
MLGSQYLQPIVGYFVFMKLIKLWNQNVCKLVLSSTRTIYKQILFKCGFKNCKKKEKIVRMERALGRHINCSLVHLGLYKSKKDSLVSRYEDFK